VNGSRVDTMRKAWGEMVGAVRDDHAMLHHYDEKYSADRRGRQSHIASDLCTRVGFQMLAAYRLMRFCVEAEIPLAPKVASRAIRHLYGSDIHWHAQLDPGVVLVHGMGLALSASCRVKRGAILFQNVTLGMGTDPTTREHGAPEIEQDVHVGACSTLVGPITVGARSKVTANCFLRTSVPPDSLVEAPVVHVAPRRVLASAAKPAVDL
jgi:serine O-acetyltransferase